MLGAHHKVPSTQHLASIYPSAYDTSSLVMPSKLPATSTWFPLMVIFINNNGIDCREMLVEPALHILKKYKKKIYYSIVHSKYKINNWR